MTYCLFFILLFFPVGNVLCQSNDSVRTYNLESVVVTATKFETDIKSSSNKIEVIDVDQIQNSNGNRLSKLLENSASIFIKSYGITSALNTISLNGLGAEHTLVLIDGIKLNSFQNGQIDLSLIPNINIERIEIVNNGMSSIYGSEAIGGTINIITNYNNPNNLKNDFSVKGSLTAGSFNTKRYDLSVYKNFRDLSLKAFYSKETSDGNFEYYFDDGINKNLKHRENAAYNIYDAGFSSQLIFNQSNRVNFYSTYSFQDKEVPGIETGTPSSKTKQKDRNWNNIFTYENLLSNNITFKTSLNFQNNLQNYKIGPLAESLHKNIVASVDPELKFKYEAIDITTGYSYAYAVLKSTDTENNARRNQHAIFVSTGTNALNNLKLFASARFDHFSDFKKNALTSQIGFNYKPFESIDLNIKASAGNNFRVPTFNDLYWKGSGNKDLLPERSFNYETGFISSFNLFFPVELEFTYTHISAKDKIVWTPQKNFIWKPLNVASSESNNYLISLSFTKRLSEQLNLRFNSGINFINSKKTNELFSGDLTKDKYLPYIPSQTVKFGLMIDYGYLGLNLFYTHTGKRFFDFENLKQMNPFNILDGNIAFKLRIWQIETLLKLEVNNITNTDYQIVSGYPMPLRNYFLTLSINY